MLNTYTYKYIAQTPDVYGATTYGDQAYSCNNSDPICLAGGPSAPNTGFVATNPFVVGGMFVTVALVVTVIVYAILKKVKRTKAGE